MVNIIMMLLTFIEIESFEGESWMLLNKGNENLHNCLINRITNGQDESFVVTSGFEEWILVHNLIISLQNKIPANL